MSHKKRRAKYQTIAYRENNSSGQEVKLQVKFQVKKHPLTLDTDNQTFNWDNADRHSQTEAIKKYRQIKFERQAEEQKQREAP